MTQALFGLVGVLVGSAISWLTELWRARRRDSDEIRVAARLVIAELQAIDNLRSGNEPSFTREKQFALEQEAWHSQKSVLARELDPDSWRAVGRAYDALSEPHRSAIAEGEVTAAYEAAVGALEPIASRPRYWRQRWASGQT